MSARGPYKLCVLVALGPVTQLDEGVRAVEGGLLQAKAKGVTELTSIRTRSGGHQDGKDYLNLGILTWLGSLLPFPPVPILRLLLLRRGNSSLCQLLHSFLPESYPI